MRRNTPVHFKQTPEGDILVDENGSALSVSGISGGGGGGIEAGEPVVLEAVDAAGGSSDGTLANEFGEELILEGPGSWVVSLRGEATPQNSAILTPENPDQQAMAAYLIRKSQSGGLGDVLDSWDMDRLVFPSWWPQTEDDWNIFGSEGTSPVVISLEQFEYAILRLAIVTEDATNPGVPFPVDYRNFTITATPRAEVLERIATLEAADPIVSFNGYARDVPEASGGILYAHGPVEPQTPNASKDPVQVTALIQMASRSDEAIAQLWSVVTDQNLHLEMGGLPLERSDRRLLHHQGGATTILQEVTLSIVVEPGDTYQFQGLDPTTSPDGISYARAMQIIEQDLRPE